MKTLFTFVVIFIISVAFQCAAVVNPFMNPAFEESQKIFDSNGVTRIDITIDPTYKEFLFDPYRIRDEWQTFPFIVRMPDGERLLPQQLRARYGEEVPSEEFKEIWREPWYFFVNYYMPCDVRIRNQFIDESLRHVGISVRGNNSRLLPKTSFNLDINEFMPDQTLLHLNRIKLQAEAKDPSLLRTVVGFQLLWHMHCPATRNQLSVVYMNDEFIGIYILADHENRDFLGMRFGSRDAPLYEFRNPLFHRLIRLTPYKLKPIHLTLSPKADLRYRPDNDYATFGRGWVYSVSDRQGNHDWDPLTNLIHILHFTPDDQFEEALERIFDVDQFLRQMAVNALIGNDDDYRFNGNNYKMALSLQNNRLTFFTHDLSNTLGINEFSRTRLVRRFYGWDERHPERYVEKNTVTLPMNMTRRNIHRYGADWEPWSGRDAEALDPLRGVSGAARMLFDRTPKYVKWYNQYLEYENRQRPLSRRILARPRYRRIYNQYIADLIAERFNPETMEPELARLHALLRPYVEDAEKSARFPPKLRAYDRALTRPRSIFSARRIEWRYGGLYPAAQRSYRYGGFLTFGIQTFIRKRVRTAVRQLDRKIFALNELGFSTTNYPSMPTPWLEIFNPHPRSQSFYNMFLTDDPNDLHKWPLFTARLSPQKSRTSVRMRPRVTTAQFLLPPDDIIDLPDTIALRIDGTTHMTVSGTWRVGRRTAVMRTPAATLRLHTDGPRAGTLRLRIRAVTPITRPSDKNITVELVYNDTIHSYTLFFRNGRAQTYNTSRPPYFNANQHIVPGRGYRVLPLEMIHPDADAVTNGSTLYLVHRRDIIDRLTIPDELAENASYGRYRDWEGFEFVLTPTPGFRNERDTTPPPEFALVINEIMASNSRTIRNPYTNEYDDWIELKNTGPTPVSLKGLFISDNLGSPARFQITDDVSVPPDGYVLIWASGNANAGPLNVPFGLSRSGEDVVLTAPDGMTIIDAISFGLQYTDISFGRFPDGEGGPMNPNAFIYMVNPTPVGPNRNN